MIFAVHVKQEEFTKAKHYMDIFERESGMLDSAEYQYRRLLAYRQDNNNIEGATKGLLSIYRTRKNTDSIGKYADRYCEANDSAHAQLVSVSNYKTRIDNKLFKANNAKTLRRMIYKY